MLDYIKKLAPVPKTTARLHWAQLGLSDHKEGNVHLISHVEMSNSVDPRLQALCDINGTVGRYSSRLPVRSIIFLGAPHKGLHTAALETLVKSKPTEDMIRELRAESPTLTELNDSFRFVARNLDIVTCYELKKSKTAIEACSMKQVSGVHTC